MNEIKISYGSWGDEQEKENVEYENKNKDSIIITWEKALDAMNLGETNIETETTEIIHETNDLTI